MKTSNVVSRWVATVAWICVVTFLSHAARGGAYTVVRSFAGAQAGDPSRSFGGLVNAGSQLYGYSGNSLISMNLDATNRQVLHTFPTGSNDGFQPVGSLASDGSSIYGATNSGGTPFNGFGAFGTVWAINASGNNYRQIVSFSRDLTGNAFSPSTGVTLVGSTLWGGTYSGGDSQYFLGPTDGTIFSINTDGSNYGVSGIFNADGAHPDQPLVSDGTRAYGTAPQLVEDNHFGAILGPVRIFGFGPGQGSSPELIGAAHGSILGTAGGVFTVHSDGTGFQQLPNLNWLGSAQLTRVGTTLYGVTSSLPNIGSSGVFSINADGTGFSVLHVFSGGPGDGAFPNNGLVLVGSTLYGTTSGGGTNNTGIVYSLTVPEPASFALTAIGLLGFVAWCWRRRLGNESLTIFRPSAGAS